MQVEFIRQLITEHKTKANNMKSNSFYHMGERNVGYDVAEAASYADELLGNTANKESLTYSQLYTLIESHIDTYDEKHRDAEGYGYDPLRDIANALHQQK